MLTPEIVLRDYYGIEHAKLKRLSGGLIHMTLQVETQAGELFILQSVAPIFKPTVMQDTAAVLQHIRDAGFVTEEIIPTLEGNTHVPDEERFWRVFSYIPGKMFPEAKITKELAYEAGSLLGQYHVCLASLEHEFAHVRSAKHNFAAIYQKYLDIAQPNLSEELTQIAAPIATIPALTPPSTFRTHTTHGDPKINNFIFSTAEPHTAISMIDLDDCGNQYNATIEVAKALKSWSTKTEHGRTYLQKEVLYAGISGYKKTAGDFLTSEEWSWVPAGMQLLSLELGTRFLIDVFEDCYFDWDQNLYESRKEHNLIRFKEQMAMYHSVTEHLADLQHLVST